MWVYFILLRYSFRKSDVLNESFDSGCFSNDYIKAGNAWYLCYIICRQKDIHLSLKKNNAALPQRAAVLRPFAAGAGDAE